MLDLSALDDPEGVEVGKPLQLDLDKIEEDPDQPRKVFDEASMAEITASIAEKGVKSPVSVRTHPDKPGFYRLNYGARRLRGSKQAGRTQIPAFIDETHDDFDQVAENEQRQNLTPMELALFISRKVTQGLKKGEIAKKLGKPGSVITEHMALIDMPGTLEAAFREGRIASPKTTYDLRSLRDKFPKEVDLWVSKASEVTRKGVSELAARLKSPAKATGDLVTTKSALKPVATTPEVIVALKKATKGKGDETPEFARPKPISTPRITVLYKGRLATLILDRRPALAGSVFIRFDSVLDDKEHSVDADQCILFELVDASEAK